MEMMDFHKVQNENISSTKLVIAIVHGCYEYFSVTSQLELYVNCYNNH